MLVNPDLEKRMAERQLLTLDYFMNGLDRYVCLRMVMNFLLFLER